MLDLDAVGPFFEVAEGSDQELATAALDVLSRLPLVPALYKRTERVLLGRLDHLAKAEDDPDTRGLVIEVAGRMGTAGVIDSLRRLANDPAAPARGEASRVLALLRDPVAPDALIDQVLEEPIAGAAESLAGLALNDAQLDRLSEVRPLPPAVLAVLRTIAESPVEHDVQKVCWWLTGDRDAEGSEVVAPEDRELFGKTPAAPRFGKLDPDAAGMVLSDALSHLPKQGPGAGNQVIELSAQLPAKVNLPVDQLLELAWSDGPLTPRQTAWILGRQGLDEAIPKLGRLILETPDPSTRRRVIDMAGLVATHAGAEPPFEGAGPSVAAEASFAEPEGAAEPETPAPAATRHAWPHLDAPDVTVVDIPFELEVGLRKDPAPGLTVSGPIELPQESVEVRVSVMAHGFVLDGSPPPTGSTTAASGTSGRRSTRSKPG